MMWYTVEILYANTYTKCVQKYKPSILKNKFNPNQKTPDSFQGRDEKCSAQPRW